MALPTQEGAGGAFSTGEPQAMFENPARRSTGLSNLFAYAPAPNGQRFLMLRPPDVKPGIHVLTNWTKLIAAKK